MKRQTDAQHSKPYLSWCLIVRNCEEKLPGALEACLKSLRDRTPDAEIVVVDTMSSDRPEGAEGSAEPQTHTIAKQYADVFDVYAGPNNTWTEAMPAFDDAAAARNRSFELAHGEILGWVDSDDTLESPEETVRLLKMNGKYTMPEGESTAPVELEAFLKMAFGPPHSATEIYCPYLFAKDDAGRAKMWQDRERFVRNDGNYCWKSKAHEVLVPVSPTFPVRRVFAPEILFIHHKQWSNSDLDFSTKRHFDIMVKGFDDGSDFNSRTAMYLGVQAGQLAPHRQDEFIKACYDLSGPDTDRYRALQLMARRAADKGLLLDAYEHVAAAISIRPELPEAYLTGGDIASAAEDWARAAEWTAAASKRPVTAECAIVSPRAVLFAAPCNAAYFWLRAARQLVNIPARETWDTALSYYEKASDILSVVLSKIEKTDPDINEVLCLKIAHDDERDACRHAIALRDLALYLCANDEPEKASLVKSLLPWQFEHSSMRAALAEMSRSVVRHHGDAYEDFYRDDQVTGAIPTSEQGLDAPEDHQLARIGWAMRQARAIAEKLGRPLRVLEVGCFDGNVALPVMHSLPKGSSYVGVEIQPSALARFEERLKVRKEWTKNHSWDLREGTGTAPLKMGEVFDIVIFFEVVEHVPEPRRDLALLVDRLSGGDARLLISTPHGSFDRGHPPEKTAHGTPRDPRGHLRALTPRSLRDLLGASAEGATAPVGIADMHSFQPMPGGLGAELVAAVQRGLRPRVNFLVMGALWDWHASHVIATGIGASEETIVYLARKLAVGRTWPAVYGPVPTDRYILDEEAAEGVSYWSHAHLSEMEKDATTVVSRAPSWGRQMLDGIGHRGKRILWLQDAVYPDLNDEVASGYAHVVVLSRWHKEAMRERHGVRNDRMVVIPNFLLAEHFTGSAPARRAHHFVYAASPDRGLITLLQMWPRILAAWPDATLDIFYGWTGCTKLGLSQPAWRPGFRAIRHQFEALRWQKGVRDCGRVNHEQIAREMRGAGYWFYPCTKFEETGCLNAAKAKAAGCTVVTHPVAALAETAAGPFSRLVPRWDEAGGEPFEAYCERTVAVVLETELSDAERALQSEQAIAEYGLEAVFPKWLDLLSPDGERGSR